MSKWVRKPLVVEATVWNSPGDHTAVSGPKHQIGVCCECGRLKKDHGLIHQTDGGWGLEVCPGAYVVEGEKGPYPCRPEWLLSQFDSVQS